MSFAFLSFAFIGYFVALNTTYTILIGLSLLETIQRRATRLKEMESGFLSEAISPPLTIVAPSYNEEAGVVESVKAFLQINNPSLNIVVVNDGSSDRTLEILKIHYSLVKVKMVVQERVKGTQAIKAIYRSTLDSRLLVVDKENGGKADALNVGLNVCRTPLVCCVDSDTLIERNALVSMVEPFIYDDGQVVAVGGTVAVVNGSVVRDGRVVEQRLPKNSIARFQIVEYLRAFLFGRMGFNRLGGNLIISGAFGLFYTDAVLQVGGFEHDTVGEDMELVVRLHHRLRDKKVPHRVLYIPDPVCYTEVPEKISILMKQRDRWQRGLADSLFRHREMFLNPRYGFVGMIVFPCFVLFELIGPVIELAGYLWFIYSLIFGPINYTVAILFFLVSLIWGFFLSVQSLVLSELFMPPYRGFKARAILILYAFLENLGYRQMTLYFRIKGIVTYLKGDKSWGKMERKGFKKKRR
jgi:cellulose synthase/poly-beta-1,6-N-acetylglucosamine synthase-like glycosyltransferase